MNTDLPEAELRAYRSGQADPGYFDAFWADTLAEADGHPLKAVSL